MRLAYQKFKKEPNTGSTDGKISCFQNSIDFSL